MTRSDTRAPRLLSRLTVTGVVLIVLALAGLTGPSQPARAQEDRAGRVGAISNLIIDQISKATGMTFSVKSVSGNLLSTIVLRGVSVRDKQGLFASVGLIRLNWSPTALFSRNVRVNELLIRDVVLKRPPAKPPANAAPLDLSFLSLDVGQPVDIRFEKLKIENVTLEPAVYGSAGRFDIEGRLILPRDRASIDMNLRFTRKSGSAPEGRLIVNLGEESDRLKVDIDVEDPKSGLVGSLIGLPPTDALRLTIQGDAPITDWTGKLDLDVGKAGGLKLDIGVKTEPVAGQPDKEITRMTLAGRGGSSLIGRQFAGLGEEVDIRLVAAYGERITIDTLAIDGKTASIKGEGWLEPATNRFSLDLDARMDDFAAVEPLVGFPLRGKGRMRVVLRGEAARPTVRLDVEADSLRLARLSARKASLVLRLEPIAGSPTPSARRLDLTLTTEDAWLTRPTGGEDRLEALSLKLSGDVDLERGTARDLKLEAGIATAKLTAAGNLDKLSPLKADGRLSLTGTIPDALLYGGRLRDANLSGTVAVDEAQKTLTVDIKGQAGSLRTGVASLDSLVAGAVRLTVDAARNGERIDISALDIKTANVSITAKGSLAPDTAEGLDVKARIESLGEVGRAIGRSLSGSLALDGTIRRQGEAIALRGTLNGEAVAVDQIKLGTVSATIDANDITRAPRGSFDLQLKGGDLTGRLGARLASRGQDIVVSDIAGRLNAGRIDGAVTWRGERGIAEGRLSFDLRRLDPLLGLAGLRGGGRVRGTVTLDGKNGNQVAAGDVTAVRLVIRQGASRYTVGRARLRLRTNDVADFNAYSATLVAGAVGVGSATVDSAQVRLQPGGRGSFAARLSTTVNKEKLSASLRGGFRGRPEAMDVTVTRLDGRYAKQTFRLARPAPVRLRGGNVAVGPARIALAGGAITFRMTARNGAFDGRVTAEALPARLLQLAGMTQISEGTLSGSARLYGRGAIGVEFDVMGQGLRRRRAPASAALTIEAKGRWSPGLLKVDGRLRGRTDSDDLQFKLSMPRRGPLDARIQGRANLETLSDSGLLVNYRMSGQVTADLTVTGSAAAPQARGTLEIKNGRFVNSISGLDLQAVNVQLRGEGRRIVLARAEATDGGSGTLKATGAITLNAAQGNPFDVTVTANRLRALRRDDIRATVSGQVRVAGSQGNMSARGTITVDEGEIFIPERLPTSITVLDVIEVNTPPELRRETKKQAATIVPKIALDLRINVPRRLFVRGRGVFAEVQGNLTVRGTADNPNIRGVLRTVRGHLDLLGKRFNFREGDVRFTDRDLSNPRINLIAEATSGDVRATVTIRGSVKNPRFVIDSDPSLPRDEVLSRIMFGKNVGELGTNEALRLATGAAVLFGPSGGASSLPDRIRRAAGLDIIDFNSTNGEPRAVFGKYVSDRILVKIEQGLSQDSSAVGVEVEVFRNFSIESKVGRDGSSRLGVKWRYDY